MAWPGEAMRGLVRYGTLRFGMAVRGLVRRGKVLFFGG